MHSLILLCVLFILSLTASPARSFAAGTLPENNLSMPVFVMTDTSTASGFYLRDKSKLYFVTARHVIFDPKSDINKPTLNAKSGHLISYSGREDFSEKIDLTVDFESLYNDKMIRWNKTHDVAVVYMGEGFNDLADANHLTSLPKHFKYTQNGKNGIVTIAASDVTKFDMVHAGTDSYVFGYPTSITQNSGLELDKPLVRKGIVSGKDYRRQLIILDCPAYYGNSGGPAIRRELIVESGQIIDSFLLIGVVSEFIPFLEIWENKQHHYTILSVTNSGYSIVEPIDTA